MIGTFSTASNDYNSTQPPRGESATTKGLSALLVNYTIQKNLESGGAGPGRLHSQNGGTSIAHGHIQPCGCERSYAPIDVPQIFAGSAAYELAGRSRQVSGCTRERTLLGKVNRRLATEHYRDACAAAFQPTFALTYFHPFSTPSMFPIVFHRAVHDAKPNASVDAYFNPAAFTVPGTTPKHHWSADSGIFGNCRTPRRSRTRFQERRPVLLQEHHHHTSACMLQLRARNVQLHEHANVLPAGRK